jgi:heptosyltransferase II
MPFTPHITAFPRAIPTLKDVDWRNGVLLRSTNWLGDLLMTLPASWQLKTLLPQGTPLCVAAPQGLAPLWKAAPWVDDVIPFPGKRMDSQTRKAVRARDFGLGVVFPNSFGSAWDLWRCGLPRILGRGGNLRSWMLTDALPRWHAHEGEGQFHQLSWYLELVSALGPVKLSAECPPLRVSAEPAAQIGIHKGAGEKWVALAPGAAYGPAKQWPPECYDFVAADLLKNGYKVVLVGSQKEAKLTASIAKRAPGALDLGGKTPLDALMSVLQQVDAVVANDSGSMHLAAALGTPGVALFASTDPIATGPLGAPWELLVADVSCRPCLQRQCPWVGARKYLCMYKLPPQDALKALYALLQRA